MSDMIWVASKDGKGWASNRTRDILDVAFTVYRETDTNHAIVEVRCPWYDDEKSRARRIIGRMAYTDHKSAKAYIEKLVKEMNEVHSYRGPARDALVERMLKTSFHSGVVGDTGYTSSLHMWTSNAHYTTKEKYDKNSPAAPAPAPTEAELTPTVEGAKFIGWIDADKDGPKFIGKLAEEVMESAAEAITTWVPYEPTSSTHEVPEEPSVSLGWVTLHSDDPAEPVGHVSPTISEVIADVQEATEPAFDPSTWSKGDPVPAGYIAIGDSIMQIGWPS